MTAEVKATPSGADTMSPDLAGATRYYAWIFDTIAPSLGRSILDIGGGYGSHLEPVIASGRNVISLELSSDAAQGMRERFSAHSNFRAICGDFQSPETRRELDDLDFDTILCLNVLEHIEDDLGALEHMRSLLSQRGGKLILQLPAHAWLYGKLDALAGHHRRYTSAEITSQLEKAGFGEVDARYFNRFGVLPWFINGRILKPRRIDAASVGAQVRIFDRYLVPLARSLEKILVLPVGQSLFVVADTAQERPC